MSSEKELTWGTFELGPGASESWKLGDLTLRLEAKDDELWCLPEYSTEKGVRLSRVAVEDEWSRWVTKGKAKAKAFSFEPILPDRSVVVKPESRFRLLPGVEAKVFVRIPISVRLMFKDKSETVLREYLSVMLSDTWFGSNTAGELSYWISSSVRRTITPDVMKPYLTVCPILLKNNSDEELLVEKLCLRVSGLSLYSLGGQLWSSTSKIAYRGSDSISEISIGRGAPSEAEGAKLIAGPREAVRKSFAARSFYNMFGLAE